MVIAQKFTAMVGLAALLFAGFAAPALADHRGGDDVDVRNYNKAVVINETDADASTGGNYAGGSQGGDGGNGGDIENDDDEQDVEDSSTGNGGNGGNGDLGGFVQTGNATAVAGTANVVNSNDTRVNRCGCDEDDKGDVDVRNYNRAFLLNETDADADTGRNYAGGSRGGDAGNGGDIENDGDDEQEVEDTDTGNGGNGGHGGEGGTVLTGRALAEAGTLNVVNRNVTRVRR